MDWTNENPGLCDLGQIDGMISQFTMWIGQFDTIITNSDANVRVITDDVWSGTSTVAWLDRFGRAMRPVNTLKVAFGDARAALQDYRDAVSGIQADAQQWRDQAWSARQTLNMSYAGNADPSPEEEQLILEQQAKRRRAQQDLDEALAMLTAYGTQREGADNVLVASLNAALPAEWPDQRAALAAVGINSIAEIANVGNLQDAMMDAANSIIARDGEYEESAAALTALLALYADDEAVTNSFFQELGGEKTVELVQQVGWMGANDWLTPAAALVLAGAIRTGLSTASTGWTQNQGESFAEGMMTNPMWNGGNIGYLFNDPDHRLGESLSVAMADAVDQWVRVEGNDFESPQELNGGTWLNMQEHEGQVGLRVLDPSGPIFSTLGHYPDAAFEWLTSEDGGEVPPDEFDQGAADDRLGFWFDTRFDVDENGDYDSNQDQLQGISELFFGALQASGGPTDSNGLQDTDVATPESMATLTHDIVLTLLENQHFSMDGVNDFASTALAGAFAINMPAFAESPITSGPYQDLSEFGAYRTVEGPGGGQMVIPVLSDDQLSQFLGVAGSHESGMGLITSSIQNYQQTLLYASISDPEQFPLSQAIDRIASLDAALQGASWGEKIETAAEHDAAIREAVGVVTGIIGAVPIPGLGEAVGGIAGVTIDWAQGAFIGTIYGEATEGIPPMFATNEDLQETLATGSEHDRQTNMRAVVATMVHTYLGAAGIDPGFPVPPSPGDYSDPNDYLDAAERWLTVDTGPDGVGANAAALDAAIDAHSLSDQTVDQLWSDYDDVYGHYLVRL